MFLNIITATTCQIFQKYISNFDDALRKYESKIISRRLYIAIRLYVL